MALICHLVNKDEIKRKLKLFKYLFVWNSMGGKYYGGGCENETWIELFQDRIQCYLVFTMLNPCELLPLLGHYYRFQGLIRAETSVDAVVFAPMFFSTYATPLQ